MKPIVIDRNSWHYRIAGFYGRCKKYTDSCTYVRKILRGIAMIVLLTIGLSLVSMPIVDGLLWVLAYFSVGKMDEGPMLSPVLFGYAIVIAAPIVIFGGQMIFDRVCDKIYEMQEPNGNVLVLREKGAIRKLYEAFKEKYCVPVEVK